MNGLFDPALGAMDADGSTTWAASSAGPADPADRVTLDESLSMAFLVVLDSMTAAERVAFILHDVFDYPFTNIAGITGRNAAACRQLASSARRRIRAAQSPLAPPAERVGLVRDFKQAWEASDISTLIGLLDPDATYAVDGGGLVSAVLKPIQGGEHTRATWSTSSDGHRTRRHPGAQGQRSARSGGPTRRRDGDGVRLRGRGWPDQAHLGHTQPRQAAALEDHVTGGAQHDPRSTFARPLEPHDNVVLIMTPTTRMTKPSFGSPSLLPGPQTGRR